MNRYSVSAKSRSGEVVAESKCDCSNSKSARSTRRRSRSVHLLPHFVNHVVLIAFQGVALSTGDECALVGRDSLVVRREGAAPPVATEARRR